MNQDLAAVVAEVLGLEPDSVEPELSRQDEDRWDSLAHLRLITAVEERFSVKFTMEEIESIQTLADVDRLIGERAEKT